MDLDDTKTLVQSEQEDRLPNAVHNRDELDAALAEGLASGISPRTTEEIFEAVIARHQDGAL